MNGPFRWILAAWCMILLVSRLQAAEQSKPNVVLIFTDDHGYGDLGCYGSPNIETPNIDRMAAEGIRFTSFYAAPFCGPSRSQLMTGCYPPRVSHARNPGPSSNFGLHPSEITVAEVLKDAGYATKCVGKWHLGDALELLPTSQGFDEYFGIPYSNDMWRYHPKMRPTDNDDDLMKSIRERAAYTGFAGQGSYYAKRGGFPNDLPLVRDQKVIETNPDQTQLVTRYTAEALSFIETHREGPFFLYLAHNMPHVPLFVSDKHAGSSPRGLYGDVLREVDWSTGQIMEKLDELGIDERTLLVFTSDNGPWLDYGIDGGSAGPLRDGKGSVYEGGSRVPAIFRFPGQIPPGRRTEAVAGTLDLAPTFAALSGAAMPTDRVIDGESLWPLLTGDTAESPHEFFHYFGGSAGGAVNYRGIRDERWKLIFSVAKDGSITPINLYDLGADVSERFDRLKSHPQTVTRLQQAAQAFLNDLRKNIRPAAQSDEHML